MQLLKKLKCDDIEKLIKKAIYLYKYISSIDVLRKREFPTINRFDKNT